MKQDKTIRWAIALLLCALFFIVLGSPTVEQSAYQKPERHLLYGYAEVAVGPPAGSAQISEYNNFLQNENCAEAYNTSDEVRDVQLELVRSDGQSEGVIEEVLPPHGTARMCFDEMIPEDTYGTILVTGEDVVIRNHVSSSGDDFVLVFTGEKREIEEN